MELFLMYKIKMSTEVSIHPWKWNSYESKTKNNQKPISTAPTPFPSIQINHKSTNQEKISFTSIFLTSYI